MDSNGNQILILASASPRRSELLKGAGIPFQVIPAEVEEPAWDGGCTPEEHVTRLARIKAGCVSQAHPGALVLGADTAVFLDNVLYGKPADMEEARKMLMTLSGREHRVLTGVALCRGGRVMKEWCAESRVAFRKLTPEIIDSYFAAVNPLDKAGAYGLQCHGEMLCCGFTGLHSTVVGLPVEEVAEALKRDLN